MSGGKRHILVVDDTEDNRVVLDHFLRDSGYETTLAANGEQALASLAANPPAAVLLDVMMPGLSGLDVLKRIRQNAATQTLPVIMVTARSESRNIVEALRAGASDYVSKPIDFDVLIARLETHLRLARLQGELAERNRELLAQMRAARAVQESLLPTDDRVMSLPSSYGLAVAGLWRPANMLGSDFWDLVPLADGSLGILLLAFAGRGMIPSLHTFRMKSFVHGQCTGLYNTSLALSRINGQLCSILNGETAAGLYARFDPDRREFGVSAAGNPGPIVWRAATGTVEHLVTQGSALGVGADSSFREAVLEMKPGDKVVFYTDGLMRFGSRQTGRYSEKRLGELLARHGDKSPGELALELERDLMSIEITGASGDVTAVIATLAE